MDTKTICLAVLCQGDTTGYEIKKAFEEGPFSYFQDVSFGSIYPALNRALAENLVSVTELSQLGRPGKKVYSISQAGRAALLDNMTKETPDDKVTSDFLFKLMFSKLLAPEDLEAIIESRLTFLDGKIFRHGRLGSRGRHASQGGFRLRVRSGALSKRCAAISRPIATNCKPPETMRNRRHQRKPPSRMEMIMPDKLAKIEKFKDLARRRSSILIAAVLAIAVTVYIATGSVGNQVNTVEAAG